MDESRYLPNYGVNKDNYVDEDEDEVEEDEEQQEADAADIQQNGDDFNNDDDDDDDDDTDGENHSRNDSFRHPKKRKLKSLLSSFEFAPRIPPPPLTQTPLAVSTSKSSFGGRNTLTDWSERETFVLLEAWGERFLQRGRKSLRSEEWQEVAEKVSRKSKIERTDTQCRNRLDTLKKKYKKEKPLLTTKWIYFKKMDMLMSSTPQQAALSCVYLDRVSGLDEMRDSPGNTDSREGHDESNMLLSKKLKLKGGRVIGGSFKLLAESINKFSEIYEKIENGKRKQMVELEKMRMDFCKELELQKRQILDRARDEIVKIRQGDYGENESAEKISG